MIAKSLQGRLSPQSMWQVLLPSLLKDEDASKEALVKVIDALNKEVTESETDATVTAPEVAQGVSLVEDASRKRPRVSLSPST